MIKILKGDKTNHVLYNCPDCNYTSKYKGNIKLHCERRHNNIQNYFCSKCNKGFYGSSEYKRHIVTHTAEEKFLCLVCGRKYAYEVNLKTHLKLKHTQSARSPVSFPCNICDRILKSRQAHQKHILAHDNDYLDMCEICGKRMTTKYLKEHMRIHRHVRDFKCDVCDKSFARKEYLCKHIRTHTGVKPFKCDICDKSFTQRISLTVHKRLHTGNKPHTCIICLKQFTTKAVLRRHLGNHPTMKS